MNLASCTIRSAFLAVAVAMAGCGSTPPKKAEDAPAKKPSYYSDDGPPASVPDNLATIPDAVPRDEPFHKFANRPYVVFGRSYVPVVNKDAYKERGIASWYGKKFHGQKTSSGEVYDMFAMTAAHKTLPIPSYAKVTNVRTGKSVVVRINDRGPFHGDRIIDLSYAAASRIGVAAAGSGLVEVERVYEGEKVAAVEQVEITTTSIKRVYEAPVVMADHGELYLQLGAFSSPDAADMFRTKMQSDLAWNLEPVTIAQREGLHRVRLGPYRSRDEASAIADKVRTTLGFTPAVTNR